MIWNWSSCSWAARSVMKAAHPSGSAAESPPGARRRRGRAVAHRDDLHAQVVLAAGFDRGAEEVDARLLRGAPRNARAESSIVEHAVDAVAALDQHVAGLERERQDVDPDDQLRAEASRELMATRVRPRRFGREPAVAHLLRHPGMILRELPQLLAAQQQEPRVADVRGDEHAALDDARRQRRGHPVQLGYDQALV